MTDLEMVKKRIVENHPDLTFARLVDGIIQAKDIKICELAEAIGCDPKTIRRICNGCYHPPKHKVISIGLALGLNINEMNMFLLYAGYSLMPTSPDDKYYEYVIRQNKGSGISRIIDCNIEFANIGKDKLIFGKYKN